jgi:hypothetical protein
MTSLPDPLGQVLIKVHVTEFSAGAGCAEFVISKLPPTGSDCRCGFVKSMIMQQSKAGNLT